MQGGNSFKWRKISHCARQTSGLEINSILSSPSVEFQFCRTYWVVLREYDFSFFILNGLPFLINCCLSFSVFQFHPFIPPQSVHSRHWHGVGSTNVTLNLRPLYSQTQTQRAIIKPPCHSLCPICLHSFFLSFGLIINTRKLFPESND